MNDRQSITYNYNIKHTSQHNSTGTAHPFHIDIIMLNTSMRGLNTPKAISTNTKAVNTISEKLGAQVQNSNLRRIEMHNTTQQQQSSLLIKSEKQHYQNHYTHHTLLNQKEKQNYRKSQNQKEDAEFSFNTNSKKKYLFDNHNSLKTAQDFTRDRSYKNQPLQANYSSDKKNKGRFQDEHEENVNFIADSSIYSSSKSNTSLRQNLASLQKNQIIQILMDQIREKKVSKNKEKLKFQGTQTSQFNEKQPKINNKDSDLQKKYNDLVQYFQEYIENTNQAQSHFTKVISDLKRQNQTLRNLASAELKKRQDINNNFNQPNNTGFHINKVDPNRANYHKDNHSSPTIIEQLQNTIQNYVAINNELTKRLEKIERNYEDLTLKNRQLLLELENSQQEIAKLKQNQIQDAFLQMQYNSATQKVNSKANLQSGNNDNIKENFVQKKVLADKDFNTGFSKEYVNQVNLNMDIGQKRSNVSSIRRDSQVENFSSLSSQIRQMNLTNQSESYINTIRVLQITNKQLKVVNRKLQKMLQKKSYKIRKLLEDLQKTAQQKLLFKQQYMISTCKLRQYELLKQPNPNPQKNLQKSSTSTNHNYNYDLAQKEDNATINMVGYDYNFKVPNININMTRAFDSRTKNTRQFDNFSLSSQESSIPVSYTYISQKQFKIQDKRQKAKQFFDESGQSTSKEAKRQYNELSNKKGDNLVQQISMKRKQKNFGYYQIAAEKYKL